MAGNSAKGSKASKSPARTTRPRKGGRAGGAFDALSSLSESGGLRSINQVGTAAEAPEGGNLEPASPSAALVKEHGVADGAAAPADVDSITPAEPQRSEPAAVSPSAPSAHSSAHEAAVPAQGAPQPSPPVSEHTIADSLAAGSVSGRTQAPAALDEPASDPGQDLGALSATPRVEAEGDKRTNHGPVSPPSPEGAQHLAQADRGASAPLSHIRSSTQPAFPAGPGFPQRQVTAALPPVLAEKVEGLPQSYLFLAASWRAAKSARPGRATRKKRNMRLHKEVLRQLNKQMVADKRQLGLRDLKPSHYVDAALSYGRGAKPPVLIEEASKFFDRHLGEEDGYASPNHYSISPDNDDWLDEMMDELRLAEELGLHGQMINVVVEAYLKELSAVYGGTDEGSGS